MHTLLLDVMGGDLGPRKVLEGLNQALPYLQKEKAKIILFGDQSQIDNLLRKRRFSKLRKLIRSPQNHLLQVEVQHTSEAVSMEESIGSVRRKPNASINLACKMAAKSYQDHRKDPTTPPAVVVSAGHSGALMASCLVHMGRLKHVERPAIAARLPSLREEGCIFIDVGANVDCKPTHLRDFAVMGALYSQTQARRDSLPRIALLSNGEERSKGNELTRAAWDLLEQTTCFTKEGEKIGEFVGYAEGKEIFQGKIDVIVTDGFVGNTVLKSLEGLASSVLVLLKQYAKTSLLASIGFLLSAPTLQKFRKRVDYAEYGAAPLLGVAGYAFICHGKSGARAIKNAILTAFVSQENRLVERLESALQNLNQSTQI